MIKEYLKPIFESALEKSGIITSEPIIFEDTKNPDHGDMSTNIAMRLSKQLKSSPIETAKRIISNLEYDPAFIESINIAGPGFINIKFSSLFFTDCLSKIVTKGNNFGRQELGAGKSVNVEYVSVNPTGLLHLGHGRNASIGDSISNLYVWLGYEVTREYYFNNAGNQMNNLAKSIFARYRQISGSPDFPFPEEGYHGEYIKEISGLLYGEYGDKFAEGTEQDLVFIRKFGENWCFEKIRNTLNRMKIHQDVYYNEDSLYSEGKISQVLEDFSNLGLSYEKDGATWLAFSKLGLEDDRVIVKSSGEPTYRLPDIAYHKEKFKRGYNLLIDIFGSDHIATIPDVLAGVKALGFDPGKVRVIIHQFVTLMENGEQVKMSKRSGKSYTLDDLLDEVGEDVVRFFLIMRGVSTHLEFDLGLAREQSEKNPVFYLQYAHARICSIIDNAIEKGLPISDNPDYTLLNHIAEIKLIKMLEKFEEAIYLAANKCEPHVLSDYLKELAAAFHVFYHECRIIGSEGELFSARIKLADITRIAIKNGLTILGISAPERM